MPMQVKKKKRKKKICQSGPPPGGRKKSKHFGTVPGTRGQAEWGAQAPEGELNPFDLTLGPWYCGETV